MDSDIYTVLSNLEILSFAVHYISNKFSGG